MGECKEESIMLSVNLHHINIYTIITANALQLTHPTYSIPKTAASCSTWFVKWPYVIQQFIQI